MTTHPSTAVGVFADLDHAEKAIEDLRRAGFPKEEIGIIGHVDEQHGEVPTPPDIKRPELNATLALSQGGIWGAIVGILVIAVIPIVGEAAGLGYWFELIGGAALGAAVGGALFAFGSLFFSHSSSRFLQRELQKGRFVVMVRDPNRTEEADRVLRRRGD